MWSQYVQAKDKFCFIRFAFRFIVDYHTLYTLNSLTKRHAPGDVTASFWKFLPRDLAKRRLLCSFSSTLACMSFGCVVRSSTSQHGISGWFHFGSSSQEKKIRTISCAYIRFQQEQSCADNSFYKLFVFAVVSQEWTIHIQLFPQTIRVFAVVSQQWTIHIQLFPQTIRVFAVVSQKWTIHIQLFPQELFVW